jgi:hypothetical protein
MRLFRRRHQEQVDPQLTALRQQDGGPGGAVGDPPEVGDGDNVSVAESCATSVISRAGSMPAGTPKSVKKSGIET